MMYSVRRITTVMALAAFTTAGTTGCASMGGLNSKEKGAIIGAAGGAAVGGAIGNNNGSTAKGAIIGAVVGGAAGAVIGHQMDQQAKEIDQSIPGADVERVGEGIQVTFDSGILFDYNSATLRPAARANLAELANSLEKYPGSSVLIVGHTDATGSDSYNQTLSERRARAAAEYLATQGVPYSRLDVQGRGEYEPISSNESASGQQQNRRVEVAIFASEAYRDQIRRDVGRR